MANEQQIDQEDLDLHDVTGEVASEGGSFGDLEIHRDKAPATGSEADELWRDVEIRHEPVNRDDTGRRSP
ncbi:MAG TPA: hypothetical protein VFA59_06300 [Vicinamibacterales bacterium]|nr:hypothetical protein [Vicinamibacterales bacterium]